MNFGVVFAFVLSLPLARLEVSFPRCQPWSWGGEGTGCGGVKPPRGRAAASLWGNQSL